jgi:aminopeptidase N
MSKKQAKYLLFLGAVLVFTSIAFYGFTPSESFENLQGENPFTWKEKHLNDWERPLILADSSHSYDVLHYRLDLNLPMTSNFISGTVRMIALANEAGFDSLSLNCIGLTVTDVRKDSIPQSFSASATRIFINLDSTYAIGDTFNIEVDYHGNPVRGFRFYPESGNTPETTAFTFTEPSDSRFWFPCYDEPWDKADQGCEFNVTVPLDYKVASNGLLTGVDTVGGEATYHWSETYGITTYLMSLAISKYAILRDIYINGVGDTIPVIHYVYPVDSALAEINFSETVNMMIFYSNVFGEYPFAKYGMAVVEPFGGAMEHQTMTTILRWASTSGWEAGIAHELAHHWWGDLVTCLIWPEIWINEGFGTYSEALWFEYKYGWNTFKNRMTSYGNTYFSFDSTWRYPLYDPPPGELFRWATVYCKGAWVLHMLRHVVGDSSYWALMPAFGDSFPYGNATTEDFEMVSEAVSGDTLDWFFDEWIFDQGHPEYQYGWTSQDLGGGNYELKIQITQVQSNAPIFKMPLDLMVVTGSGDTTIKVWNDQIFQQYTDTLSLPAAPIDLQFDPDNWVLELHEVVPYGIEEKDPVVTPARFHLSQNKPNPFHSLTTIHYQIPKRNSVRLEVYDIAGRLVETLVNERQEPGVYQVQWEGKKQSSGIYFYRLQSDNIASTKKLVLLRR